MPALVLGRQAVGAEERRDDPDRVRAPQLARDAQAAQLGVEIEPEYARVETSVLSRTRRLTSVSTERISSAVIGLGWLMSKRWRSGATSEPFCVT